MNFLKTYQLLMKMLLNYRLEKIKHSICIKKSFQYKNIENISKSLNFKKLDVYIINKNLSSPYKVDSELDQIEILGSLGK